MKGQQPTGKGGAVNVNPVSGRNTVQHVGYHVVNQPDEPLEFAVLRPLLRHVSTR